jgi:hypothetical protein
MADLSLNRSRRRRSTGGETGTAFKEGGTSVVQMVAAVVLVLALAALFIAPNEVDSALNRTATVVSDKATTNQVWSSVVSTFSSEDAREEQQIASASPLANAAMLKPNERVAAGAEARTMLTRGHDIIELEPTTTIADGDRGVDDPMSIIQLISGTIHVKAAKRTDGGTLSIETQYLVATVKGTKFDVATTDRGAAVSVSEGIVWVRAVGSNDGVDVMHGRTVVVLAGDGPTLRLSATAAGGALAAIEAASSGTVSNSNHHKR